jgi:lipopolysaccharide transport system permease protein
MRVITPFLLQLWLYATPVLYPLSALPPWAQRITALNPMTPVVEAFRKSLFGGAIPSFPLLYAAAISAVVMITGALYFRRSERQFADIL